jgi:hypothetical protein
MSGEIEVQRRTDHRAADDKIAKKRGEKKLAEAWKSGEVEAVLYAVFTASTQKVSRP